MSEIISRIKLEATGADQAAREIQKMRDAYNDVLASVDKLSNAGVGAAGVDPFSKATGVSAPAGGAVPTGAPATTAPIGAPPTPTDPAYRQKTDDVMNQITRSMRDVSSVSQASSTGNLAAAATGARGIAGSLLSNPILGAVALAAGAAVIGTVKEFEMIKTLSDSGITRRLSGGETYETVRDLQLALSRTGDVDVDELTSLLGSLGSAGGGLRSDAGYIDKTTYPDIKDENGELIGNSPRAFQTAAEQMTRYGIDSGLMGQFLATTGRAGYTGTNENNLQLMANVFGTGRTGQGISQAGAILEEAMSRGARQGSLVLEEGAGRIAREAAYFATTGGFSMEAAFGLVQKMDQRAAEGARPQTPLDAMVLRTVMQLPEDEGGVAGGMSLFQAQEWITRNPVRARNIMMQTASTVTGGDRDLMGRLFMNQNLDPSQAGNVADLALATEGQGGIIGSGLGGILREGQAYGNRITQDTAMTGLRKIRQMQLFAGVGGSVLDIVTKIISAMGGDVTKAGLGPDSDVGEAMAPLGVTHLADLPALLNNLDPKANDYEEIRKLIREGIKLGSRVMYKQTMSEEVQADTKDLDMNSRAYNRNYIVIEGLERDMVQLRADIVEVLSQINDKLTESQ